MSTEESENSQRVKFKNQAGHSGVITWGSSVTVPRRAVGEYTEAESSGHFLALVTLQLKVNRSNRASSYVRFPEWSHYFMNGMG